MANGSYNIGDRVRSSVRFANISGEPVDPTTVRFKWKTPGAGTNECTWVYGEGSGIVRDSVGEYHADITLTSAKTWYLRWVGSGAIECACELPIQVVASAFSAPV